MILFLVRGKLVHELQSLVRVKLNHNPNPSPNSNLEFGDGLGLWLSSGHLLLSGDELGLGFWVMVSE